MSLTHLLTYLPTHLQIQLGADTLKRTLKSLCEKHDDVDILYSVTYVHRTYEAVENERIPEGLLISSCKKSAGSVYFEESYEEALRLFKQICPDKEFLVIPSDRPSYVGISDDQDDEWAGVDVGDWVEEEKKEEEEKKKIDDRWRPAVHSFFVVKHNIYNTS